MTAPPLLDADILERWRAAASQAGAPVLENLVDGLTDAEIDAIVEPLGLRAPPELRTLWRWATTTSKVSGPSAWEMFPGHSYVPPARAVEDTFELRDSAIWGIDMPPEWMVVWNDQNGTLCVNGADHTDTSVYVVVDENRRATRSIGELVEHWTQLIERGLTERRDRLWLSNAEVWDDPTAFAYGERPPRPE